MTARPIDALAEALAEGAPSVRAAARSIGISQNMGARLFRQMCRELGPQAV
jgi:hypothetical protein